MYCDSLKIQCFFLKLNFSDLPLETVEYNDILYNSVQALKVNYFFFFPGKINTSKFWRLPMINFSFMGGGCKNMLFQFDLSAHTMSIKIITYKRI